MNRVALPLMFSALALGFTACSGQPTAPSEAPEARSHVPPILFDGTTDSDSTTTDDPMCGPTQPWWWC